MKKMYKWLIWILLCILFSWIVYATITIASTNKSSYLPWQGTPLWEYDAAHNVWNSNISEARFTLSTPVWWTSTVLDSVTWLTWQSNWVISWSMSWEWAKIYCDTLDLWWSTDWKLPNRKELNSILDLSTSNPIIDTTYFTTINDNYWSSTSYSSDTDYVWITEFGYDSSGLNNKTDINFVRCVR